MTIGQRVLVFLLVELHYCNLYRYFEIVWYMNICFLQNIHRDRVMRQYLRYNWLRWWPGPFQRQAIIWINTGLLFHYWTIWNIFQWNFIRDSNSSIFIYENAYKNNVWKVASICLGLNALSAWSIWSVIAVIHARLRHVHEGCCIFCALCFIPVCKLCTNLN